MAKLFTGITRLAGVVVFLLVMPQGIYSQSPTNNSLTLVQGTVEVRRGERGDWTGARLKDVLNAGDQVRTGERSRAEIALGSGTVVKLASFSEYEVPPTTQP